MMARIRFHAPAFTRAMPVVPVVCDKGEPLSSVAGKWNGWWVLPGRSTAVGLTLQQDGPRISGVLTLGRHLNNRVRGTIDVHGFVRFEGTDMAAGGGTTFSTVGMGLALGDGNNRLEGLVRSRSPRPGSSVLAETEGTLTIRRAL